jgi:membrane associated rhomboid family serine protease
MTIWNEIKSSFKEGGALIKLIYINIAVFVIINLIRAFMFIAGMNMEVWEKLVNMLSVPAYLPNLIYQPWSLISYMFFHIDFLHILFNLLWLYWFGKIFLAFLDQKKLVTVYLWGGIVGALLYIVSYNIFPVFSPALTHSFALGASASVIAIVVAISFYNPNYKIFLMFFGSVRLINIALITIVIDLLSIGISNPGGHIAHLGGALFGYLYISGLRKGYKAPKFLSSAATFFSNLFTRKPKMKVMYGRPESDYDYNKKKVKEQAEVDHILEKIAKGGYESLSKKEKETLFKSSKN